MAENPTPPDAARDHAPRRRGIEALPYRPCVGLAMLDSEGRIFAGQRVDTPHDAWQMPQGGIDAGETPRQAALRELREETGIPPGKVEILRESRCWLHYDLPPSLVPRVWGGRYRGQKQRWFALRFHGSDADIDLAAHHPEFARWAWMHRDTLLSRIVPFKRDTYGRVFAEFADLL
ncbi:MAG TPA: RNA pyrophosphohydrolase [Thermohalobaculum sp.]|nr:RNA pyrophosphohydrolase [Thermohalobaculum sp.]